MIDLSSKYEMQTKLCHWKIRGGQNIVQNFDPWVELKEFLEYQNKSILTTEKVVNMMLIQ